MSYEAHSRRRPGWMNEPIKPQTFTLQTVVNILFS